MVLATNGNGPRRQAGPPDPVPGKPQGDVGGALPLMGGCYLINYMPTPTPIFQSRRGGVRPWTQTHFDPPAIRRLLDRFAVAASERRQARRASA